MLTESYNQWVKREYFFIENYKQCVNRARVHGKVDVHGNLGDLNFDGTPLENIVFSRRQAPVTSGPAARVFSIALAPPA